MGLLGRLTTVEEPSAVALTSWRELPEYRRAEQQAGELRTRAATAERDYVAAQTDLADLRGSIEQTETEALLGDVTTEDLQSVREKLPAAETAVAEAARLRDRVRAASRAMDVRLVGVESELKRRYNEQWLTAYSTALERLGRKLLEAARDDEELARLWELGATGISPQPPSPLQDLLFSDNPADPRYQSRFSYWIREARRFGLDL